MPNLAPALIQGKANLRQLWEFKYARAYYTPVARLIIPQDTDAGSDGFIAFLY